MTAMPWESLPALEDINSAIDAIKEYSFYKELLRDQEPAFANVSWNEAKKWMVKNMNKFDMSKLDDALHLLHDALKRQSTADAQTKIIDGLRAFESGMTALVK
ncbi:hypothetical protein AAVH_26009 [Aphelenchoides avenae]|nr:hypothetical protein AAVH_28606 [Aphelenchus avenae]KAH7706762.1 hypothetical protein AAVH_26009 [Aphelenchus avenae]